MPFRKLNSPSNQVLPKQKAETLTPCLCGPLLSAITGTKQLRSGIDYPLRAILEFLFEMGAGVRSRDLMFGLRATGRP
jgi:hypothetical protein